MTRHAPAADLRPDPIASLDRRDFVNCPDEPSSAKILVTGGAGYIGSHVVRQLVERGERVVVLDNLSTGYRSAVLGAPLVVGDTGDRELVARVLREHQVDTVLHFAAHTIVPESVSNPLKYYGNNTCATRNLLEQCDRAGVKHFVFSSTAAVYGIPAEGLAREDSPTVPINPYGTVQAHERVDAARPRRGLRHCATSRCVISTSRAATPAVASATAHPTRRCS